MKEQLLQLPLLFIALVLLCGAALDPWNNPQAHVLMHKETTNLQTMSTSPRISTSLAYIMLHSDPDCPSLHWYMVCCSSAALLYATGGWLCNLLASHVDADRMWGLGASSRGTLPGLLASLTFCSISLPAQSYLVLSAGPFQPTAKLHASGYVLGVLHLIIRGCNHHQPGMSFMRLKGGSLERIHLHVHFGVWHAGQGIDCCSGCPKIPSCLAEHCGAISWSLVLLFL